MEVYGIGQVYPEAGVESFEMGPDAWKYYALADRINSTKDIE